MVPSCRLRKGQWYSVAINCTYNCSVAYRHRSATMVPWQLDQGTSWWVSPCRIACSWGDSTHSGHWEPRCSVLINYSWGPGCYEVFCLGTEVPRLSALGVGPTVRGTSEVQSAQEWKCKVHNSILQNGGLDWECRDYYKLTSQPPAELRKQACQWSFEKTRWKRWTATTTTWS